MSSSVNVVELAPVDAAVCSAVNGVSKLNCQSVSVVKTGQDNALELGTLIMSVGGGDGGKLWVTSPSDSMLQVALGPVDEKVKAGDDCAPFGASIRTSAAALPVSSSCDRLSGYFSADTDPTDVFEDCRFLETM